MEDEECLPENSSLRFYLQSLGYSDLQVTKSISQNPSGIRFEVTKAKSSLPHVETIDEDIIDQISIIISTQMLFEEDVLNVEKLLSNFKIIKNGVFKSMFKGSFGVAVIFLGLCLYWIIGYYALFIVSSFYAFTAAEYLRRKHNNLTRLKKLTSILQANFVLLKKTVKFIEENKLIVANNALANNSEEFLEGFDFYKNFKSDFLICINEMISILIQSTQKLIKKIPLYDHLENCDYYLCNNFNKDYESADLSKLYEIYLLVQSEFLQRLILSLIPNITVSAKDGFCELNKILTETCVNLLKIKNKLNRKFKFIFFNGIHSPKTKIEFKSPLKNKNHSKYFTELVINIHETSKCFQNLLIKSRILEDKITLEQIPNDVEEELAKIQADLNACQRNITDSLILLKKSSFVAKYSGKLDELKIQNAEDEEENSTEKYNKIMVGYTDLDPKIEDEIFEAYFTNENFASNFSDIDDLNLDDKLQKKLEKEYCKNVMKELKVKLVEKAKYWKKRERELLMKKGITDEREMESSDSEKDLDHDNEIPFVPNSTADARKLPTECEESKHVNVCKEITPLDCKPTLQVSQTIVPDENIDTSVNEKFLNFGNENSETAITPQTMAGFNKGFLNDLNQVRQKIFNSSLVVKEELFCASGEDSSENESS